MGESNRDRIDKNDTKEQDDKVVIVIKKRIGLNERRNREKIESSQRRS